MIDFSSVSALIDEGADTMVKRIPASFQMRSRSECRVPSRARASYGRISPDTMPRPHQPQPRTVFGGTQHHERGDRVPARSAQSLMKGETQTRFDPVVSV